MGVHFMTTTSHQPNYYAVIPAHVRFCKEIEMGAKLLYAEITSLTDAAGYCWATNKYFAELYDVDISTIKRWISSLQDQHFINIEIDKHAGGKRKIWISQKIQKNQFDMSNQDSPSLIEF